MKYFLLFLILIYQQFVSPFIKQILGVNKVCRFSPTCSAYARTAIEQEGAIRGSGRFLKRFLRCQAFFGN